MNEIRPPSPPHSTNGDLNKDRELQNGLPDPFTPPINMAAPAMSDYDHYGDPSMYHTAGAPVYYERQPAYYHPVHRQYNTPPPPDYIDSGIHTRSGRALGSPDIPKRREPPTKRAPQKRARKGGPKAGAPQLAAPLSDLTKDYTTPIKDMEAWVNRPADTRRKESEAKQGYVGRPMNSFMLYRSAYADRVKQYCKETNHQEVSRTTGASWPMEPDHVRKFYERLALLERDNHAAAFPTYKFAPNKNGKKRARDEDDGDSDGEWAGSGRTKRSRTAGSSRRGDTPFSREGTPFDDYYSPSPYQPALPYNPSAYDHQYPRGPAPVYYDLIQHGQYYQPNIRSYGPGVEDISFGRVDKAFPPPQDHALGLIGMPSVDGQHLMAAPDEHGLSMHLSDMVDPRLGEGVQLHEYRGLDQPYVSPRQIGYAAEGFHPGLATLTEPHNVWSETEPAGAEFERILQQA